MEKYTYLVLGVALLVPLVSILLWRKDLAPKALKLGMFGGAAGLVSEFFYFRDYWRPPSVFGAATLSIEDFIFGFAITGLSFIVYPSLTRRVFAGRKHQSRSKLYIVFFAASLSAMLLFNLYLGINSIFVSSSIFVILSAVMLHLRRDLLMPAIQSAIIINVLIIAIYLILFDVLYPNFWDKYWLLTGTKWGVTILGNLPLTELLWYFSWVFFASISYPFASGKVLSNSK